jgi:hypothetical protein
MQVANGGRLSGSDCRRKTALIPCGKILRKDRGNTHLRQEMKLVAAIVVGFVVGFLVGNGQPKLDTVLFSTHPTPAPVTVVATPAPVGSWMFDKGRTDLDRSAYGPRSPYGQPMAGSSLSR